MKPLSQQKTLLEWLRNGVLVTILLAATAIAIGRLWSPHPVGQMNAVPGRESTGDVDAVVNQLNEAFQQEWAREGVLPTKTADTLLVARRLALALVGTLPSVQEIRGLQAQQKDQQISWYLDHLLADRRHADFFAERFARAFVGVEDGPFIVYRRRRLVEWLGDALAENRPYDQIVRQLIDAKGIWTNQPEVNFVTATVDPEIGPNRVKLAARVSRAFLGVRMDCVECHDGKLGSEWKQTDFHQLAAFFGQTENSLLGVTEDPKKHYEYRYLNKADNEVVPAAVPWSRELLPPSGQGRERLASWVTAPGNRPFSRAIVNRVWALLFNKPLMTPLDDIPLAGPFPTAMELLADDFIQHGYDLRRLIRIVSRSLPFQLESRSADVTRPVSEIMEKSWAAFPLTRLRPDQVAGSIIQSASLKTIDAESHVVRRLKGLFQSNDFLKRYGDLGEDEFESQSGTITQRLLMMNGEVVNDHVKPNPVFNASSRISQLAPDPAVAVQTAYLACLTRHPTEPEAAHFKKSLNVGKGEREAAMADLYWTLLNSTEFSWNH